MIHHKSLSAAFITASALALFGAGCASSTPSATPAPTTTAPASYSLADIAKHATRYDCWMAINGSVYDVTDYIASGRHNPQILEGCGIDATTLFESQRKHSGEEAQQLLEEYYIGKLK